MRRRNRSMDRLALVAVVLGRHIRRNQLALALAERIGMAQQHLNQLVEGFRRLGPEGHGPANSGKIGQCDVRHKSLLAEVATSQVGNSYRAFSIAGVSTEP